MSSRQLPVWAKNFEKKYKTADTKDKAILNGFELLKNVKIKKHKNAVDGLIFDNHLLHLSPIYRKSRELYLERGGTFQSHYISKLRMLSTDDLLTNTIQINDLAEEYKWLVEQGEAKDFKLGVKEISRHFVNVFHEQNHKILMSIFPNVPRQGDEYIRFMNFNEGLAVAADLVLGHQLEKNIALFLFLNSLIYQKGTARKMSELPRSQYREFVKAFSYSVYLFLCFYPRAEALKVLTIVFKNLPDEVLETAVTAGYSIDPGFRRTTNSNWLLTNRKAVQKTFNKSGRQSLKISDDPLDYQVLSEITDQWFDKIGIC